MTMTRNGNDRILSYTFEIVHKGKLTHVSWQITNIVSLYFHAMKEKKTEKVTTPEIFSSIISHTPRKLFQRK